MFSTSDPIINPSKDINYFKAWMLASRPRTLPISFVPIIVGTTLARYQVESLNWMLAILALLCSLFIQIGTNLVNDALDYKKGADSVGRLGPLRVCQSGLLSFKQVFIVGCTCYALSLLCGIPLILAGGWPLAFVLCISILCGYLYTGGPRPLAYTGISDLFVLMFFGWVSTGSVYYLQTGQLDGGCLLAATQIGLLAIIPHAINNLRDHISDARVQKRTLAVRFGPRFARWEIAILSLFPFLLSVLWMGMGAPWMSALPWLALPFVIRNIKAIWQTEPSPLYNQFLATSALCQLLFGCLLAIGRILT